MRHYLIHVQMILSSQQNTGSLIQIFFYNESDEHKINGAKSTLLLMSLVVLVIVQTLEHFLIYINFGID